MCGPSSAIGLTEHERALWPELRERLRVPGHSMAMMRGVLGSDAEVAVVVSVTPAGIAQPLALVVTPAIAAEITDLGSAGDLRLGRIAGDEITVVMGRAGGEQPIALLMTDWIREHLFVYARELWHRPRRRPGEVPPG